MKQQRAAIYIRVSSHSQHTENQLPDLQRFCQNRGWKWTVYRDQESGANETRPGLTKLLQDAHQRKFGVVVCWAVDRVCRNTKHFLYVMDILQENSVQFVSYTQPILATDSPQGKCFVQLLAVFAELERSMLSLRTRAGLQRARRHGKRIGRPPLRVFTLQERIAIQSAHNKGKSVRRLARENQTTQYIIANILAAR